MKSVARWAWLNTDMMIFLSSRIASTQLFKYLAVSARGSTVIPAAMQVSAAEVSAISSSSP